MTTGPGSSDPASNSPASNGPASNAAATSALVRSVFRTALRYVLVLTAVVTVAGVAVGGLLLGAPGVWGGLIGGAIALLVAGATPLVMLATAGWSLMAAMAALVGEWLAKSVVVLVALALLRGADGADLRVIVAVVSAGLLGSVLVDGWAVQHGRVPYVTPADRTGVADDAAAGPDADPGRDTTGKF